MNLDNIARHYRGFYLRHNWTRRILPAWRVYAKLPPMSPGAEILIYDIRIGD